MSYNEDDDLSIVGFTEPAEVENVVHINTAEQSASGYCSVCHKRYTNAPVVNGIVICPNCNR